MTDLPYTVAANTHSRRYPWRWWCRLTIPATAISGDTSMWPCPAGGIAITQAAAEIAAQAHRDAAEHVPTSRDDDTPPTSQRPDQGRNHTTETR